LNEFVFVFGSNDSGFHGAGMAGFAFRGDPANTWRECPIMRAAMGHGAGYKGLLAVFGQAQGFQEGTMGKSYAIQTVTRPGNRRSVSLPFIDKQVDNLVLFMREHPELDFCLTPFGCGFAGYFKYEMRPIWDKILTEPNGRWSDLVTQPV